jgi:hypothetical protein
MDRRLERFRDRQRTAPIRIELSGEAGSTRGGWSVTLSGSPSPISGTLSEYVQGPVRNTTFFFAVGCPSQRAGEFLIQRDGSGLRGTYFVDCASLMSGSMTLFRQ